MGEAKIHMQKPLFRAMEALTLRRIGPHFLLYTSQDIAAQYIRWVGVVQSLLVGITLEVLRQLRLHNTTA